MNEREELLAKAQYFVDCKYVARADARQKSMGLAYVEVERRDLAREIVNFTTGAIAALPSDPAQGIGPCGELAFGAAVENIAASDRNPIKRGIFIRKTGSKMAEYATKEGCHSTPLDNLRAAPASPAQSSWQPDLTAGMKAAMEIVGNMRQSEAGLFDPMHSGQRGEDRSNALYDAYCAIRRDSQVTSTQSRTAED